MIRRAVLLILALLIPVAVLLLAGRQYVTREEWVRRRLHEVVAIQLAQTLDSEVRVGRVEGDLVRGYRLRDVSISDGRSFADGTLASAKTVEVKCNTWAAVRGRIPPIEAIEIIRVVGLRGRLTRDVDGKLNVQRLLPKAQPPGRPGARFRGRIVVEGGEISYSDQAPKPPGLAGLELRLANLDAIIDLARPSVVELAGRADGVEAPFARVEVSGSYLTTSRALSLNGGVTGADLAALYARFWGTPAAQVLAGKADVAGNVCLQNGELVDFALTGQAAGLAARLPALGNATVLGQTHFMATPAGVALRSARLTALGAEIHAEGVVVGLTNPALDITASAEGVDLSRWAVVAPKLAARLPITSGGDDIRLEGRVTGSPADPDVTVSAAFLDPVRVQYAAEPAARLGGETPADPAVLGAEAAGLTVTVSAADARTGAAVVRVQAAETRLDDLAAFIPPQEYVREVVAAPIRDLDASIVYAPDRPAVVGRIALSEVRTDRGILGGVQVRYALLGKTLRAEATVSEVLGGRLAANGVVDLTTPEPQAYAQFDVDGADLGMVAGALGRDAGSMGGTADATGTVALHEGRLAAAAELDAREVRYDQVEVGSVRGHVGVDEEKVDVRHLVASGPLGALWARGTVPFEGAGELEVTAAGVPVARVQALAERAGSTTGEAPEAPAEPGTSPRRLTGVGFAHGWLRGELRRPEMSLDVALFGAGVDDLTVEALTAAVEATPERVAAEGLLARRGTAVLSGSAGLDAIVWPVGSFFSDERVPGEQTPTTETSSMDGRLSGNLQVRGFDLVQVSQLATLPENLRLAGLTTGDVQLGGTILNPEASGRLAISGLRGTDETRNVAVGPLEFTGTFAADRDSVRLEGGRADSEAGSLTLSGELGGWNAEEGPVVAARFEATDLPLSAYLPTGGAAGLLEGMIDRVSGTVTGPLGEPWPSLRASLAADELRFGRRRATDLRADLGYSHGVAAANRLTCGVAGGRVRLAGASYQPSDDKLFADLALSDLDAQQLLFLVADIASAGRTSEEAAALRDRIYAYGHRVRGRLSAGRVLVGGTPDALEGRAELLTVSRVELDRRSVPGLTAGFRFSGLALREPEGDAPPPSPRDGVPAALAHLRVEGLRAESDPIAGGAILVHGADITRDATIDMAGNMEVVVEADLVPLGAVNDWLPPGLGVGGQLSLTVRATGPVDDPEIEGSLDVLNPTVAGVRFDLLQAANVALSEDSIVMTGGLLKRGLNEVQAEGSLPFDRDRLQLDRKGPVAFRAQVEELPAAVPLDLAEEFTARQPSAGGASTFWGRCQANGLLTAWLTVEGTLGRPEVTGGISIEPGATFRLAGWPSDSTIADISGDVLLGPSPTGVGSTVEAFNLGGRWQETRFTVEGAAEVSRLEPDEWLRNRVDELTLKVTADRQPLPGGTVAKDLRVAAQARTDAEGRHVVTVQEGTARLGRGSATLAGHVIVDTLDPRQFGMLPCDLRLLLDRAQVRYGTLLDRAQVDGAVVARKFASRDGRPLPEWFLAGRGPDDSLDPSAPLRIASATLDSPAERGRLEVTRATLGLPSRERTAGSEETAATPAAGAKKALLGSPAYLPSPRLDLTVGVGHSVDFETVIAKAEVTPDPDALRITGTPQAPEVHGSASLRHGSLRLLRGNLEVPEAGVRVALSPLPYAGAQPPLRRELQMTSEVWGRAEGIVSGTTPTGETIGPIDVELELSGGLPPDHVLVTRSDPPLTSEEVYELLAVGPLAPGGQLASDRSQTVDEMIAGAVASRVFRGVLEPLEEELSETLGLEQFDIRVGLNQPVEFRVGKYLIDNLLVSYSRTAGGPEEEYDLRVSYKLKDRYQVTWHADERQQSAFAVEYRWQF